ncbi:MAG: hypothetical protein K1X79_12720 [Oligoflexia bacterium]|nr:hypothetical protein [Oligoflexia bacterium]
MKVLRVSCLWAALIFGLAGCEPSVPAGRILIKNDSQDSSYNIVKVSGGGRSASLKPGDSVLLPKGVQSISFSRAYKDYVRRYEVSCPSGLKEGILIKLIDVHLNRMPGGCQTVGATKR